MPLQFTVTGNFDQIGVAIKSLGIPVAQAATEAITEASLLLKQEARAMIRSAGFSSRWANAYRTFVFPKKGASIDAAAFGLLKDIAFSDIFATGGTITGKPFLWLPFSTTPKLDNRRSSASIKDYRRKGVELFAIHNKGHPILGAKVQMSLSQSKARRIKVTRADVLRGFKKAPRQKKGHATFVWRVVPLFFGLKSVTIRKRFDWDGVTTRVSNLVPSLYERAINRLADAA